MAASATKRKSRNKFDTIKSLKEDFLTCGICLDVFENPKSLICLHKFCEDCLQKYVEKSSIRPGETFTCPMKCKETTTLPKNGIKDLKTDFILKGLEEFLSVKEGERKSEKVSVKHIFPDELTEPKSEEATLITCTIHEGKKCELFCEEEECLKAVCMKCMVGEHNGHRVEDIETLIKTSKEKLHNLGSEIQNTVAKLRKKDELHSHAILDDTQISDFKKQIEEFEAQMIEKVKERSIYLKACLTEEAAMNNMSVNFDVEETKTKLAILQSLQTSINDTLDLMNPADCAKIGPSVELRLSQLDLDCIEEPIEGYQYRLLNDIDSVGDDWLNLKIQKTAVRITGNHDNIEVEDVTTEDNSSSDDGVEWNTTSDED